MKKGYLATGLSLTLLLAGCFDDPRNGPGSGFNNFGNNGGMYGGAGGPVNEGQFSQRPQRAGQPGDGVIQPRGDQTGQRTPTSGTTNNAQAEALRKEAEERARQRTERREVQGLAQAFADILPSEERSVEDETTLWQQACITADKSLSPSAQPDQDKDGISDACEKVLGTTDSIYNGWIGNIMVADAKVLVYMISKKITKLKASSDQGDKDMAAAAERELTQMGYTVGSDTPGKPRFWNRVENTALSTSNLDRLVGLWISLGKQFYRSDIPIYQELYALLSDPTKVNGDELRGSKLFLNPQMHPNVILPNVLPQYFSDEAQPFALMKGGYEQQIFVNHENHSGNISITDIGGAGSNMQTIGDTKGKAIIAIYEGFSDATKDFTVQLMTVNNRQGFIEPLEGLGAFYAGGNLEAFSARLGAGLGRLTDVFKRSRARLQTRQVNAETEGKVYPNSHMAAIFINLEKAPVVPSNFFLKSGKTPAGALQYEMLPQHVSRMCPLSAADAAKTTMTMQNNTTANRLITFEALKYCPGFEKYDTLACPPSGPGGGYNAPCQVKDAISSDGSTGMLNHGRNRTGTGRLRDEHRRPISPSVNPKDDEAEDNIDGMATAIQDVDDRGLDS